MATTKTGWEVIDTERDGKTGAVKSVTALLELGDAGWLYRTVVHDADGRVAVAMVFVSC